MNEKKIKASYMDHVNNEAKLKYLALTMLMLIMLGVAFIVIGRHTINVCGESNYFAKYLGQLFEAMESLLLCTPLINSYSYHRCISISHIAYRIRIIRRL